MTSRPSFSKDGFYSGYDINGMYTKNSQEEVNLEDNDGDGNGDDNIDDDGDFMLTSLGCTPRVTVMVNVSNDLTSKVVSGLIGSTSLAETYFPGSEFNI